MSTELTIAGEMGKGGGGSIEYKDTLISEQTAKTLFAVGEGIIEGVEDVYLDTISISNFDADWSERQGLPSQTPLGNFTVTESPLPGFTAKTIIRDSIEPNGEELPNISTGIAVAATSLVQNTWYRITSLGTTNFKLFGASKNAVGNVFKATSVGTGTGTTVQMQPSYVEPTFSTAIPYEDTLTSVRLTLSFAAMTYMDSAGNMKGSSVIYAIYSRPAANATWTLVEQKTVKGKSTHGYVFDRTVSRPASATLAAPWEVKVVRVSPDSGSTKKQNTMQWSATTLLYDKALPYNGTALVGVILRDASQFGNRIPEIMFKVKGKKMRLPYGYNPTTRTYPTTWDGTMYESYLQYTNNPAWCLYDVLTNAVSGLGIPDADLDKYSFYNLSKYCDEQLPNGFSLPVICQDNGEVLEEPYPLYIPRHTLDYSFNTRESVKDFLSQILSLCNANLVTNEFGQVAVIFQQRGQIVKRNVTNANVIDGTFTYQSSNIEQRTNLVNVTYNRGLNFGRTDTVTVSDDSLIERYGLRPTDIVLPGCYHEAQAVRKARWALYTNCYFTDFITFSVFLDGMTYKIGDLIRVYDNYNQTNTQSGILTSATVSNGSTTLTFDREITLPAGSYTFHSFDSSGNEVSKVISGGVSLSSLVISSVFSVNIGAVFILTGASEGKTYRVTSISRSEENIYSITALEFDEAIFDYIDSGLNLAQKTGDFANVGQFSTLAVETIQVRESFGTNGTYTSGRLSVSWIWDSAKTQKYRANYKLSWAVDDSVPTVINTISSDTYDIMNPIPGIYTISVWAVNSFTGIYSQVLTTTYNFRTVNANSTLYPPVNLRIAGSEVVIPQPTTLEFSTPELTLAFDYNPDNQNVEVDDALSDYIVEIWQEDGLVLLETYTVLPIVGTEVVDPIDEQQLYKPLNGTFALPFNRNVNIFGGVPVRTFKVKVYSRDLLGDLSLPITITVTNPVPDFTSFTVTPDFGKVRVDIEASAEIDSNEYFIYRGTTANFSPSGDNLFYKGLSNSVALTTPDTNEYFYKCAISDSFGSEGLNYSTAQGASSIIGNADFVTISGEQFFTYASGATTPRNSTITLTATLHGTLTSYLWQYWNGSAWATLSGTAVGQNYILYPDNAAWGVNKSLRIRCLSDTMAGEITIVKISDGAAGSPGLTTATVYIYQRLAGTNPPALPTVATTYTFSSGVLTGLDNGWVTSIPAGTDPLYVSAATASAGTLQDTIQANEWATPVVLAKNGIDGNDGDPGANGINTATIYLYQTTTTSTPPSLPNADLTYTFSNGALVTSGGAQPDPWKRSLPTTGNYRWVTTATALSATSTDIITTSEWAAVSLLAKDGTNAAYVVVNGEQAFKFTAGSSIPTSSTITLTAALFGGLTTYSWEYWSGAAWTALSGVNTNPTYSLAYNNTAFTGTSIRIRCSSGTSYDEITVLKLYDGANGNPGNPGISAVNGYLTNETSTLPANSSGVVSDYSLASGNFKVFSGTSDVTGSCTFSVTTATINGLTLSINTGGGYSVSGALNTDSVAYTLNAVYSEATISKVVNITKAKTGSQGIQGIQGIQGNPGVKGDPGSAGKSAVRAYQVTSSAGTPPSYTTSTNNGTLPGVSWSSTQGTVGVNQFQWQIDGIADYSTGSTTWTNPYLSVFKVDTLAAFTVNTGALNVSGNLSVTGSGAIRSGTTAYGGNSGYYIGLSGTTPVMSMLNASGKGLTYDGSNVNFSGALSAATGSFGGTVTVGSSPAVSGATMTGSGAVLNSNGTFAIGNSTANISFNGSTFTFNGNVVGTANINANAISATFTGSVSLTSASWSANTFQYTSTAVQVVPPTSGRGTTGQLVLMTVAKVTSASGTNRAVKLGYQYSTNGSTWYNLDANGGSSFQYYTNNGTFTTTDALPLPFNDIMKNSGIYPNLLTSTDSYWIRLKVAFTVAHTTSYTFNFTTIALDIYK